MSKSNELRRTTDFSRGRQIAYLIYDYFRTTGSYDEIKDLSGLFNIRLEDDDIQNYDLRWEQASLSISDLPSDKMLQSLYLSKLQNSFQIQTIMALYKKLFEEEEENEIITD